MDQTQIILTFAGPIILLALGVAGWALRQHHNASIDNGRKTTDNDRLTSENKKLTEGLKELTTKFNSLDSQLQDETKRQAIIDEYNFDSMHGFYYTSYRDTICPKCLHNSPTVKAQMSGIGGTQQHLSCTVCDNKTANPDYVCET